MNTAGNRGIKGCGFANVPGACYDAGGHISGARAVISCAADYMGSVGCNWERGNHVAELIGAAGELLKLASQDIERLELELKAVAPEQSQAQQE